MLTRALSRLSDIEIDAVAGGVKTDVRIDPIRGPIFPHPGHGGCYPFPVEPPMRPIDI